MRLAVWGGSSLIVGIVLLGLLRVRKVRSSLLDHFGIQTAAWGAVDLALALAGMQRLELRDLTAATRLDRFLWLNIGLDVGYAMVGITLVVMGWRVARRPGLVGAGLGVVIQGFALAILDLLLAGQISR
jgi:hypothetical protein